MINRARLLSQAGTDDSNWGIHASSGILFKGTSFVNRDRDFDEFYPFASTITFSGIDEVFFSQLYGEPNITGTITLTALSGDTRRIAVEKTLGGSETIIIPGEDVRMRIDFAYIKNNGNGSAEAASYVGPNAVRYEDGAWIPIVTDGQVHVDGSIYVGATGLAVERGNGFVRIMAHGDLGNGDDDDDDDDDCDDDDDDDDDCGKGGKEIVDAYITFEHASVDRVENDYGSNECEQPFNGVVNNGVGGDEVTQPNERQVFFQTRVTNYGDSILIYWEQDPSRWL